MLRVHRVSVLVNSLVLALSLTGTVALAATAGPAAAAQGQAPARPVASLVANIAPGAASSDPQDLTVMNGKLFFSAWSPRHGRQLWESGGTAAGTVALTNVPGGADPQDLAVADGVLFFSARDAQHGRELWKSDGTAGGTTLVDDIVPGRAGSDPRDIVYAIGPQDIGVSATVLVYFSAWQPGHGRQLWLSNGSQTVVLSNINSVRGGLNPEDITPLDGEDALFSGDDGTHGREPWFTNGSIFGTYMYTDLNPGPASSDPADFVPRSENEGIFFTWEFWYFSANDGTHGRELVSAYDEFAPAIGVTDINPGAASSRPGPLVPVVEGQGLVAATGATGGRELYEADGSNPPNDVDPPGPGHASALAGLGPGHGSDPVVGPTSVLGISPEPQPETRNYFSGDDGAHGQQLWQVDEFITRPAGEASSPEYNVSGVHLVADIGARDADPAGFTTVGNTPTQDIDGDQDPATGATEVFSANDGRHGRELWASDGWSTNTALAADVDPGRGSSNPADITVIGQTAYFTAYSPRYGRELWQLTVPPTPLIWLDGPQSAPAAGSPVTLTASLQAAPGDPDPAGRVTFYRNGTAIGSEPLTAQSSGGSAATLTTTTLTSTDHFVAVYTGDRTYTPATSNTVPNFG
ncbi:MAG TPA: ELWxxDGT repeat protein [Streptosporangiaceae bacterium]|jgi:ELWxxDGT repeat protein|nr:ELWxxDGT repeat protein [Streptosporangiaceae bacterium]